MKAETTGTLIAKIRQERNMTQTQLAEMVHVSDKIISKWENGKGFPDISVMESHCHHCRPKTLMNSIMYGLKKLRIVIISSSIIQ